MAKIIVSASIEEKTKEQVLKQSNLEKRSFSQMIDLLLLQGLEIVKNKQRGSNNDSNSYIDTTK